MVSSTAEAGRRCTSVHSSSIIAKQIPVYENLCVPSFNGAEPPVVTVVGEVLEPPVLLLVIAASMGKIGRENLWPRLVEKIDLSRTLVDDIAVAIKYSDGDRSLATLVDKRFFQADVDNLKSALSDGVAFRSRCRAHQLFR